MDINSVLPLAALAVWFWYRPLLRGLIEKWPRDKSKGDPERADSGLRFPADQRDCPGYFRRRF